MTRGYTFFAPEVVQTSAMDCGPAVLKSFLQAFGLQCNYESLREACQTSLDGTSIDTIEQICLDLGLDVTQHLVPRDMCLLALAPRLPAIIITRESTGAHFIVVWRMVGNWLQIMDPGTGRRWVKRDVFLENLYNHEQRFSPDDVAPWMASSSLSEALALRLREVAPADVANRLLGSLNAQSDWRDWSALEATTRTLSNLSRDPDHSSATAPAFEQLLALARADIRAPADARILPKVFWSVSERDEAVSVSGVVFLANRLPQGPAQTELKSSDTTAERAVALTIQRKTPSVFHEFFTFLRRRALLAFVVLTVGIAVASASSLAEFFLFRAALSSSMTFTAPTQRLALSFGIIAYLLVLLILDTGLMRLLSQLGRSYELFLRTEILRKTARLGERYVSSRPVMDLAQRAHRVYLVRELPDALFSTFRLILDLTFTVVAISLISARIGLLCVVGTIVTVSSLFLVSRLLIEVDLRFRSQASGLLETFLDALLGAIPIRTHGLGRPLHAEQEVLLTRWFETGRARVSLTSLSGSFGSLLTKALAVAVVLIFGLTAHDQQAFVLLILWALRLPAEIQGLATRIQSYPGLRNALMRVIEPLRISEDAPQKQGEPDVTVPSYTSDDGGQLRAQRVGVSVGLQNVTVLAGGTPIVKDITLKIRPGEHVAIVGRSGAGKSSLLSLLLGAFEPERGTVEVDGAPLTRERIDWLHHYTAWVDPSVQLWNHSLLHNIQYGTYREVTRPIAGVLAESDLIGVLERLEHGLRTKLGSNGSRLSGGEGQRVRFARAIFRANCRLVLLDEPFRGLDRAARARLMTRTRELSEGATLLCATHDIRRSADFPRVLVIEDGRVVEDGPPRELARNRGQYRALLEAEIAAEKSVWQGDWIRLNMDAGMLRPEND